MINKNQHLVGMAKQKKQKKSGLAKRQQAKINRKKEVKKKLQAKQAPPEKKNHQIKAEEITS